MNLELKQELTKIYKEALQPPFLGGFKEWAEQHIILPPAYSIPGRLDLNISPYLHAPMRAIDDPRITQVNCNAATQTGKSLIEELFIPYIIINKPGPAFRIFHSKDVSDVFAETRLIPLLKNCPIIAPLLKYDRFSTKKSGIILPHMAITLGSSATSLQHGMSVKYLLCDEVWQFEPGTFQKFMARTTAFASRRKIICASQPGDKGSEWEAMCDKGLIYAWTWLCEKCNHRQEYYWSKEKKDGSYAGMNWDSILNDDGSTNIAESAKTAWLECENCNHKVHDTPAERLKLNQTGGYICIKRDGDPTIVTYNWGGYVNINIPFKEFAAEYMIAKRIKQLTGLDEQLRLFTTQKLGKFYKREQSLDISKILVELYDKDKLDNNWVNTMGVDVQRIGGIKYWVVRAWNKNGNESRRIGFGIVRTWEELENIRKKHNVLLPMVAVDSGDGEMTPTVYQECVKHGTVLKTNLGNLQYISWVPTKGDQKVSYKHLDNVTRLYSQVSPQDAGFPVGHKLKGVPAGLVLFSNYSLKTILANLRDNNVEGIKWLIDHADEEYDKQIYSEGLVDVIDKKSGLVTQRWMQQGQNNHLWDCEVLCLLNAMRANVFSATQVNEENMRKIIDNSTKKD